MKISPCLRVLVLVYCFIHSVEGANCTDCYCCQDDWHSCFSSCISPNQCTGCNNAKYNCLADLGCSSRKRTLSRWKSNERDSLLQARINQWNDKRTIMKYLLDELRFNREKKQQTLTLV